jgi:phage shock protein A
MDVGDDSGADGVWMTYGEIATVRGIKRVAAIRLVQRHKWRKQAGNDGLARVLIPPEWAKPGDRALRDITSDVAGDVILDGGDVTRVINALETSVASLTERAEAAERRADRAEKLADQAASRADRAEEGRAAADARADRLDQALAGERARADALRDRADELTGQLTEAKAEGNALTVETDELRRQVEAAQMARAEAEADAVELLQADAARRGRGRLARLRAAWRVE